MSTKMLPPKFKKIGEYIEPGAPATYTRGEKSKKRPIVYLFVVDGSIKYIGETRRGYSRPLDYHKNKVMEKQRDAIFNATSNGQKVEIFAHEVRNKKIKINGIDVDCYLAQDYEKALIQKYNPEWNGRS